MKIPRTVLGLVLFTAGAGSGMVVQNQIQNTGQTQAVEKDPFAGSEKIGEVQFIRIDPKDIAQATVMRQEYHNKKADLNWIDLEIGLTMKTGKTEEYGLSGDWFRKILVFDELPKLQSNNESQ